MDADEQLLAATAHDPRAFGEFYARHERAVFRFFLPPRAGRGGRGRPELWLFGIARNVLRRSAERRRVESRARARLRMAPLVLEDDMVVFAPKTFAGVDPVALPKKRQVERLDLGRAPIRLVGYGVDPEHGNGDPVFLVEGYRQTATAPFRGLTPRQLLLNGDAAATRQGGICLADSGSPQLLAGTNLALALTSTVAPEVDACRGVIQAQRLDTPSERRFLGRYLP
jgi:hypothetical protein